MCWWVGEVPLVLDFFLLFLSRSLGKFLWGFYNPGCWVYLVWRVPVASFCKMTHLYLFWVSNEGSIH